MYLTPGNHSSQKETAAFIPLSFILFFTKAILKYIFDKIAILEVNNYF